MRNGGAFFLNHSDFDTPVAQILLHLPDRVLSKVKYRGDERTVPPSIDVNPTFFPYWEELLRYSDSRPRCNAIFTGQVNRNLLAIAHRTLYHFGISRMKLSGVRHLLRDSVSDN